jgi:hypothetical protein
MQLLKRSNVIELALPEYCPVAILSNVVRFKASCFQTDLLSADLTMNWWQRELIIIRESAIQCLLLTHARAVQACRTVTKRTHEH